MIPVTKTFLPPQEEYNDILKRAWDNGWITNRGELVQELESKIKSFLGVKNVVAMTNGTLPIQIAIKALGLKGEIITTPFSYVATTSSIVWEGCKPVFVDIHPKYLTIDETKIEAAITEHTSGILATHVYGNPCNVEVIEKIAKKHHLKVIYDAAHCFGVMYKGKSIFTYGDISTCSFHATKVFHTGEGGAAFCSNKKLAEIMFSMHNFGHKGPESFDQLGINAKMSELQAAMGLAILPHFNFIVKRREEISKQYDNYFKNIDQISVQLLRSETERNFSYYPILFKNEGILLKVKEELTKANFFPRRYFYPSLNKLPYIENQSTPLCENISRCILCLPLYFELTDKNVLKLTQIISESL
jgi:dTDP-4-amino-4,6-dideoxygalactose transaminase